MLEVIIATAILASSALVLSSLLGLGTKFGGRAEARTEALSDAESLLAEFLALDSGQPEQEDERTGILNSNPPRSFRIRMTDAPFGGMDPASRSSTLASPPSAFQGLSNPLASGSPANPDQAPQALPSRLVVVAVEVFESAVQQVNEDSPVLCRLSQLVRVPATGAP